MNDLIYSTPEFYHGVNLIADAIHRYIPITYPEGNTEPTERDLLDSRWLQRLRRIHQLQSAWWVYPCAEHSRFVHSIGVMHVAGHFANHLYPSLSTSLAQKGEPCPSLQLVEETMRVAGLCHDLGHGPFGHFFDENYLKQYGITHEDLSQLLITTELAPVISALRRSPSGRFAEGEFVNPQHVAFLIRKPRKNEQVLQNPPLWIRWLQPLFCGIFTVDNIDYSLRDAYMCGISARLVDMERLCFYTFFTPEGLTFHLSGLSALEMFLKSRWYLYKNVYYHRTVRGIDIQLRELFKRTISEMIDGDPRQCLEDYVDLTDYSLLETVNVWNKKGTRNRTLSELAEGWRDILERRIVWKRVYEREFPLSRKTPVFRKSSPHDVAELIRGFLPEEFRGMTFAVDMPEHDPRPVNPAVYSDDRLMVYNPSTKRSEHKSVNELFPYLPGNVTILRIYGQDGEISLEGARALSEAAERALISDDGYSTNI
jgi:HD superfamily phosphohydrolase